MINSAISQNYRKLLTEMKPLIISKMITKTKIKSNLLEISKKIKD